MSDSRIPAGVIYKAVLLAFALVIGAMVFRALSSLILGLLIVVIVATPLSAFAELPHAGTAHGPSAPPSGCSWGWARSPGWSL